MRLDDSSCETPQALAGRPRAPCLRLASLTLAVLLTAGGGQGASAQPRSEIGRAIKDKDYVRAMDLLERAIDRGDAKARTLAGLVCVHALGDRCSQQVAVRLLSPAAEAGNRDAQYALGMALLSKSPQAVEKGVAWMQKAARAGHVVALFFLGQVEVATRKPERLRGGVLHLRRAAELGYAPAQVALAALYMAGTGVGKSYDEAARWYRAAADQGHRVAQTELGALHEQGLLGRPDGKAADRWYQAAAQAGYAHAQYSLGMMYMMGKVVEQDYYEGILWLERAAKGGHAKAQDGLGRAYYDGIGVEQDRRQALEWFLRAGEQGYPPAQHNAGAIYEHDVRLRDYRRAAHWYERAAKSGYEHAMISLGDLYRLGRGVTRSLSMAQAWYGQAAKSKDSEMAERARKRMEAAMSDSLETGMAAFGLGRSFPTPGELFDAIIGAGLGEMVLYPGARPPDPDVRAAIEEVDRNNRHWQQRNNDITMEGFGM